MLLTKAIDRFLEWRRLERDATPKSIRSYYRVLSKLADDYPDARLTDFEGRQGTEMLRRFLGSRWGNRKASTRGNVISYLHSFFAWAESEDLIEADPSRKIRRPPKRKPDIYRPTENELTLGRRATTLEERPAWLLMEGVGLRAQSVCDLQWKHLDLNRGRVRAFVKGAHWLNLPIDPEILDELRQAYRRLEPDPDEYVFTVELEQWVSQERRVRKRRDPRAPATTVALYRMVQRVCKRAGIRPVGPHALRHGFASRLARRGVPQEVIQALMGHADPRTTQGYMDEIRLEQLEAALSKGAPIPLGSGRNLSGSAQAPFESATEGAVEVPSQASPAGTTGAGSAAKPGVEAAGIEPASADDEPSPTGDSGLDAPEDAESGVT